MDLRSNNPYWLLKNGIVATYPSLSNNLKTEVAIIGAGITGALIAWHLCRAGIGVVIIDKRHVGMGSTAGSTALLQYEVDTPLHKLCDMVGEARAVQSYQLCLQSVYDLRNVCASLKQPVDFELKESFQYASFKKHVPDLKREFQIRKKHGISLKWVEEEEIMQKWGFSAPAGLLSKAGAQVDPYQLTHQLLLESVAHGLTIYDSSDVTDIVHGRRGVKLICNGQTISANHLVMATGYESQKYISKRIQTLHSTYAIVSEPLTGIKPWYHRSLIWETAVPYLYFRTTPDNRILVGGKDDEFSNPVKRDEKLASKSRDLEMTFAKKFPHIPFKTDFRWAGTFASTKDGLPYIGTIAERPHTFFALGFGGNGITCSVIAAQIIRDKISGKKNDNAEVFSFNR